VILLPVWLCTICSIRGSLFSNSCPQELHLSLFDLCVLFIWWASDTWMVVVFGHIRHLCSSFMYIIIVFVHYLFNCTRLTLSLCVLFNLVLSSDFFHYRQNMEMFPRHEHFFWCMSFVHFPLVFKGEFIITVRTLKLLLVKFFMWSPRTFIFNTEKLHFLQFLTNAATIICWWDFIVGYWVDSVFSNWKRLIFLYHTDLFIITMFLTSMTSTSFAKSSIQRFLHFVGKYLLHPVWFCHFYLRNGHGR